jgi:glycerol-3-phosphate dehydrogenase
LNYADARSNGGGRLVVQDHIGGGSATIEPAVIVNATGGWIDITNGALFAPASQPAPLMGGTKGSHLIVDNAALYEALADHMIYYENEDGRICILFPYLGKVLVGSTDIRVDDPETVRCEQDERDYILQSLSFVLPEITVRPEEVSFQFSGVRPLPASTDAFTGRIPRDHFCTVLEATDGGPAVLCMIGGKWTTFRSFGELAADLVLHRLGRDRRIGTTDRPIGGGRRFPLDRAEWIAQVAAQKGLPGERMSELFARYGTEAEAIAAFISAEPDAVLPHPGYSRRELLFLIRNEAVERLDDVLLRRTTLAISGNLSLQMMDAVLDILSTEKGWTPTRRAAERQRFLTLLRERHGVDETTLSARNEQRSMECETTAKSG